MDATGRKPTSSSALPYTTEIDSPIMSGTPNLPRVQAANRSDLQDDLFIGLTDLSNAVVEVAERARQGNPISLFRLGQWFEAGEMGVPKNEFKAHDCYTRAARMQHRESQYRLARCYAKGRGTDVNLKEAYKLYHLPANSGHDKAMLRLAELYDHGPAEFLHKHEALDWYEKAAAAGSDKAKAFLASAKAKELIEEDQTCSLQ